MNCLLPPPEESGRPAAGEGGPEAVDAVAGLCCERYPPPEELELSVAAGDVEVDAKLEELKGCILEDPAVAATVGMLLF